MQTGCECAGVAHFIREGKVVHANITSIFQVNVLLHRHHQHELKFFVRSQKPDPMTESLDPNTSNPYM